MSAPALALSFFDAAHDIYGTARSGVSILFEGRKPTALSQGPEVESTDGGWRAVVPDGLSLEFEPVSPPAELGGVRVHVTRVRGEAAGRSVDGLGTVSETEVPPQWEELDAIRAITALVDEQHAVVALARRPRGAVGHGDEEVVAALVEDDALLEVETARISTVYDGGGRQRSAGLELWLPGEDYPRRATGSATAGASIVLGGVRVDAAVFEWRMEGRVGAGSYELALRDDDEGAA